MISNTTAAPFNEENKYMPLAKAMVASFSEEYNQTLKSVFYPILNEGQQTLVTVIDRLFHSMEKILFKAIPGTSSAERGSHVIMVGNSGVGKSALVGNLLGKQLVRSRYSPNQTDSWEVLDYLDGNDGTVPEIGHDCSKTKGARAYGRYIDAGGLLDTAGPEDAICNAIGVMMLNREIPPGRVIVVINSDDFDPSNMKFIKLLQTLRRCIPGIDDDKGIWSSILFVVNNKTRSPSTTAQKISQLQTNLTEDRDELLREYQITRDHIPENLNPSVVQRIAELEEQVALLDRMNTTENREQNRRKNVIDANLLTPRIRQEINDWLNDERTGHLSPTGEDFIPEHLVPSSFSMLNGALRATALYFNIRVNLLSSIPHLEGEIAYAKNEVAFVKKDLSDSIDRHLHTVAYLGRKNKEFSEKVIVAKQDLEEARKKKMKLVKRMDELQEDTSCVMLERLEPSEPITARTWLAKSDLVAKSYTFSYNGGIPIDLAWKSVPGESEGRENLGFYSSESEPSQLKKGKFFVRYTPGWHGYEKDKEAFVILLCQKRHHPETKTEVELLKLEIQKITDIISHLLSRFEKAEASALFWSNRIKEEFTSSLLPEKNKLLKSQNDHIRELEKELEQKRLDGKSAQEELVQYGDFCRSVAVVINRLGLLDSAKKEGNFSQFCNHFQPIA